MADARAFLPIRRFGATSRSDAWWLQSALVFVGFTGFIIYSTWAAFQPPPYYEFGNYLSPMYSPMLFGPSHHSWFGGAYQPAWWPGVLPYSATIWILWAPLGFRFTCYYYRGAYYKAFWADPVGCAVGEPRSSYRGEQKFPLLIQNIHRYFLYVAVLFILVLGYDAWVGYHFADASGAEHLGIGIGSLVLTLNVILIASYTFGCHSMRHLVGGALDVMTGRPVRKTAYVCSTALNRRHMLFAWMSLIWVGFTDLYVRMCSMGIWHDFRLI